MQVIDAIVVIEFARDPGESYTQVWRALSGVVLEQRAALPAPVLVEGSLLELALDGESRELRVDHLRWEHARQTLYAHVVLTEAEAGSLRELGLKARRPWVRRRAVQEFLERCRRSGWNQRGAATSKAVVAPVEAERIEPTL
jgi:hypothetical protein